MLFWFFEVFWVFLKHPSFPKCQDLAPAIWGADHKLHHYYITLHGISGQTQLVDVSCSLRRISPWKRNICKYDAPTN